MPDYQYTLVSKGARTNTSLLSDLHLPTRWFSVGIFKYKLGYKLHDLLYIRVLSLVEITTFRLDSKSCKGFFLKMNFPPMRALEFITGHVTF